MIGYEQSDANSSFDGSAARKLRTMKYYCRAKKIFIEWPLQIIPNEPERKCFVLRHRHVAVSPAKNVTDLRMEKEIGIFSNYGTPFQDYTTLPLCLTDYTFVWSVTQRLTRIVVFKQGLD